MTDFQILTQLAARISTRRADDPAQSYTASLFSKGQKKIAQKLIEEAGELAIAAACDDRAAIVSESADLVFHWLVLCEQAGVSMEEVMQELQRREGRSGLDEKASRAHS